jgi:negative regulator of flagellin synthesis FlgM
VKITNDQVQKPLTGELRQKQTGSTGSAQSAERQVASSSSVSSSVSVSLSPQMQSVLEQSADTSVFDAGKVEAIKSAIASGQFSIDPEKVADGLLSATRDFLQRTGG